ncbi:MAG: Flp family type IVb pilin [Proteobacteria bacterium]|nr:Flp family type IVb pilin [Pseudomonadota bacterium]
MGHRRYRRGATAIEYGVLAALIAITSIVSVKIIGLEIGCSLLDTACMVKGEHTCLEACQQYNDETYPLICDHPLLED